MALKIEKGGWLLIFLIGAALVGYSLNKYGIIDLGKWGGSKSASGGSETVDASKPLLIPASSSSDEAEVRVRVNVWVGCVGGLVANGGLDTAPDSIYGKKGLKVSFKIIDDWTEGASALATNNVDVMLTTADVYAKDYAQFRDKGFGSHAFLMVDWSRGADGVIGKQGINSIEDLAGKTVAFAPYTPSHFLLWNGLKASGLSTDQRNEIFNKAVHTKDGIEPATLFPQGKVDAAVAWDPDMSDAVAKRPGAREIYDRKVANSPIADLLAVIDRCGQQHLQATVMLGAGLVEGVEGEIANFMRAYGSTVVDIEGNTDSTGSRSHNIVLSKARADAVKNYLNEKYGFPAPRMRTRGNGPDSPIDTNATAEGREKNRRTDIKVYPNPAQ